jgi:sigma-E factor negative regulatory protein RseA
MEPKMNNDPVDAADDPRRLLSAMADGEADASEIGRGCAAWAADAQLGERWHAYHLIGDVLRSEDLAHAPARDQAFLQRLRSRLDEEPAILAPQPLPVATPEPRRRSRWMPMALAAGVMALATVVVVALGPAAVGPSGPTMARAPEGVVPVAAVTAQATQPQAEPVPPGGRVLRDAQLDRYLRAHREYATALPGSLPGGAGRSITTVALDR